MVGSVMRHGLTTWGGPVGAGLMVALILVGCRGGGGMPMEAEPAQTPRELLQGTWLTIEDHPDRRITSTVTLTSDRWVRISRRTFKDGRPDEPVVSNSGAWSATDTAITKVHPESVDSVKEYHLSEDGQTLTMTVWRHESTDEVAVYQRIAELPSVRGRWSGAEFDENGQTTRSWEVVLEDRFSLTFRNFERNRIFEVSGTWTENPERNTISVTLDHHKVTENGIEDKTDSSRWEGRTFPWAYARDAFFAATTMAWSIWSSEVLWDEATDTWVPHPDRPYGAYRLWLVLDE